MKTINDYDIFAQYYDLIMGNREKAVKKVSDLLKRYAPNAKTLLELGVGTGSNLYYLKNSYDVVGLDLSQGMLDVAKDKLPHVPLIHGDMTDFQINKKFDAIVSLFDTVNHLSSFEMWQQMFRNTYEYLNDDGVFIFDINTVERLEKLAKEGTHTQIFSGGSMEMTVVDNGLGIYDWHVVLKTKKETQEEHIQEVSYPARDVITSLSEIFKSVESVVDVALPDGSAGRVYFIARK